LIPRNREEMLKVFCPTGEGGGIDPTCSPGGGHSGGTFHDINNTDPTTPEMDHLRSEVEQWKSPEAKKIAHQAIEDEADSLMVFKDAAGKVQGLASVVMNPDESTLAVSALASNQRGVGTALMHRVFDRAVKENVKLTVWSTHEATGFYKKLGMRQRGLGSAIFVILPEKMKRILAFERKMQKQTESEEIDWASLIKEEPTNGCFSSEEDNG
jgi:N-acetylglutamate synthase-like GNAT family acetyltransferase